MAAPTTTELKTQILEEFNGADDLELSAHVDFLWNFYGTQSADRYALYYYTKIGVVDWLLIRNWHRHDITEGPIRRAYSQVIDNLLTIKKQLKDNILVLEANGSALVAPVSGLFATKAPLNFARHPYPNPNSAALRGLPLPVLPDEEVG